MSNGTDIIIQQTPPNLKGEPKVDFKKNSFESLIWNQGYRVLHEKTLPCPCKTEGGENLINCKNCGGVGWIFINPVETKMVLHSMNLNTQFKEWSEEKVGTVTVSCMEKDKIAFMDRLTLLDSEAIHTENLYPKKFSQQKFVYTTYRIKEILEIFQFVESDQPLKRLIETTDYTTQNDNTIIFDDKFYNIDPFKISVRYKNYVSYFVIDMVRDIMNADIRNENTGGQMSVKMPLNGIARRVHYVWDIKNMRGFEFFNNSYQTEEDCKY